MTDISERVKAKKQLEEKTERLDSFASFVAHDLRNPLNVAVANLALVEGRDGEEEYIQKVKRGHERMETLINELLALARNKERNIKLEPCLLCEVARTAWEQTNYRKLSIKVCSDMHVEADVTQLQQIFENLFRNTAEHAAPDATIRIKPVYHADDVPPQTVLRTEPVTLNRPSVRSGETEGEDHLCIISPQPHAENEVTSSHD